MTYKLVNQFDGVKRSDGWSIPFDPANTDYARFKSDLADGVELQDAEGNAMSSADIQTFLAGLK
jgi:hypothetical protein